MKTNKSVLVSGGTGFIGSHTAVELINAGYSVVIVDNLSNSEATVIDGIERITGQKIPFENVDTCDLKALRGVFERHDFDSVIHFAAFKAVGESVSEPLKYYQNNLVSFMNILELMKEFGRHNVVFSSSATVYGDADELPVTEQSPRKPATSPYGNTKQMCEDILRDSIKAEMLEQNTEELEAGQYIIRWTSVLTNRFDTTAFKKEHNDLYKEFTKQTSSKRFSIA